MHINYFLRVCICVFLAATALFALSGCDINSSQEETTETSVVKTPLPTDVTTSYDEESNLITETEYSPEKIAENSKLIFEYFDIHINEIKNGKASVSMTQKKKITNSVGQKDNSVPFSDNGYINAAISSLDGYMLHNEEESIRYGENLVDFLPVKGQGFVSSLTLDDIEKATCSDSGGIRTITVTLKSPALPETIEKAFDVEDLDVIMDEFEKANSYLTFDKPVLTYCNCQIIITVRTDNDEVVAIEYIKPIDVKTQITGQGSLSEIGTVPVNFTYKNTVKYTIDRTEPSE